MTPFEWALLALGAATVGFAKTAVGGAGALAVVAFAAALPVKESTGALLPLLCVGDVIAVRVYHRHADWAVLLRMLPGVLPGLVLGAWFLGVADDTVMRRSIGAILLTMSAVQIWQRRARPRPAEADQAHPPPVPHKATTVGIGVAAGFATMTANAAGPVTTLYLLMAGLPKLQFLGTAAWFYLVVNATKIPFSAGLDLISLDSLHMDLLLVPALCAGVYLGVKVVRRIDQAQFERAALALATVAAAVLMV